MLYTSTIATSTGNVSTTAINTSTGSAIHQYLTHQQEMSVQQQVSTGNVSTTAINTSTGSDMHQYNSN